MTRDPDICCAKFLKKKKKSCKDCPLLGGLPKKQRKRLIKQLRKD
jgi:hypothetical protein